MTGTKIFQRMIESSGEYKKDLIEAWTPTPFMVDVLITTECHRAEIRNWLNLNFGYENDALRQREGNWRESFVTMHGHCWYGFKTEELMKRFMSKFPQQESQ